jgi:hypothetical protein
MRWSGFSLPSQVHPILRFGRIFSQPTRRAYMPESFNESTLRILVECETIRAETRRLLAESRASRAALRDQIDALQSGRRISAHQVAPEKCHEKKYQIG